MSLAYKVEELLALRDSVSESAVSIDRFADGDVIKGQWLPPRSLPVHSLFTSLHFTATLYTFSNWWHVAIKARDAYKANNAPHIEHVLRPSASASANLASRSSGRSLRPPVAQPLAPAGLQKRPSPTPSIKRGKAEKLLKEHGSPPGMRVTAGGRVVPSDLPPLGTSRFPDNTFKPATLRITPSNIMSAQTQSNNNATARIDVVGGQPVILIGDRMFALPTVDTSSATTLGASTAMETLGKQPSEVSTLGAHSNVSGMPLGPPRANSTSPIAGLDLSTLKAQQLLKKQELRTVEQTEVLQANHQTDTWRANMIEKKRSLIVELDALRKAITALESENDATAQTKSFLGPVGNVPGTSSLPTFVPHLPQPVVQPMYSFQPANTYTPMMMYPSPYSAFQSFTPAEPTPFVAPSTNPPHSPGSASRRSHAIEIKPPQEGTAKQALNPKSPTYEPTTKSVPARNAAPPTPSPPKRSPWRPQEEPQHNGVQRSLSQKPSFSSVDTTDFFPTNTHEHSSTRLAPRAIETKQVSVENTANPSTPEKRWPASPWNEGNSGHSRNNEPTSKLTSWPEAFGKQISSSSLRQSATEHPHDALLERAPVMGAYESKSASNNHALLRSDADQRTGMEENWSIAKKPVSHVPSTFQEGFQAGYDHVGVSDNPEVIQGYIHGLYQFLSDESKRTRIEAPARDLYPRGNDSRTSSLRGLVAGSMPHDSAVSMTFNRSPGLSTSYENVKLPNEYVLANMQRDTALGPLASGREGPGSTVLLNEAIHASQQRKVSSMQYPASANLFANRVSSGRKAAFTSSDMELEKFGQDKGSATRVDPPFTNSGFARQFSGAQIQNRGHGTPLSNQRFHPTSKEMSPTGFGTAAAARARPFAGHRLSGLDGAMDDLADLVMETHVKDDRNPTGRHSAGIPTTADSESGEVTASCFKQSNSKGKQKATGSPMKASGNSKETSASSPNLPSSPKKSGEHSPAKAKLEQVTNKLRRKKDDPRTMSPEEKLKRSEKWRQRFQVIKKTELEEIEEYKRNTRN
jgi:hypothetical protein